MPDSDDAAELQRAVEAGFHVHEDGMIHVATERMFLLGAEPKVYVDETMHNHIDWMGAHVDLVGSWCDGTLQTFDQWARGGCSGGR